MMQCDVMPQSRSQINTHFYFISFYAPHHSLTRSLALAHLFIFLFGWFISISVSLAYIFFIIIITITSTLACIGLIIIIIILVCKRYDSICHKLCVCVCMLFAIFYQTYMGPSILCVHWMSYAIKRRRKTRRLRERERKWEKMDEEEGFISRW